SVLEHDQWILDDIYESARKRTDNREENNRNELEEVLVPAFHLSTKVNGQRIAMSEIKRIDGKQGFDIRYELPEHLCDKLRLDWDIRLTACSPRTTRSFPIVLSQPTHGAVHTFDATGTDIDRLDCFPREAVNWSPVKVEGTKRLTFQGKDGRFSFPGEGQV